MIGGSSRSRAARRHGKRASNHRLLRAEPLEPRLTLSAGAAWPPIVSAPLPARALEASAVAKLRPVADASVNGAAPFANYGGAGDLLVRNDSSPRASDDAEAYLKFDLSGVHGRISKAVLQLTPRSRGQAVSRLTLGVQLLSDSDDGWVEGSGGTNSGLTGPITSFNSPNGVGKEVFVSGARLAAWRPVSIDVTSLVNQDFNANQIASFVIMPVSRVGARQWVDFVSSENRHAAFRPLLVLTVGPSLKPPPSVLQQPAASDLTGTSVQLAALGAGSSGGQNLVYTWSAVSPADAPPPTFSDNGTNSANNTTATFHGAGTYAFTATITDPSDGLSVRSAPVSVTVDQSLTGIQVAPSNVTLYLQAIRQFAAQGVDQFGQTIAGALGGVTWSVSGAGTIDSGAGLYTAPATATVDTVTAQAGALSATATVHVTASTLGLKDPALDGLVRSLDADGSIGRDDMLSIFRSVETENGGVLSAADFSDLETVLQDAAALGIPGYVQVLAGDVINGNPANAHFQGQPLGDLAAGSTATQLDELVGKWFLGADHPDAGGYGYSRVGGSLFPSAGPSHHDEEQGYVGDCYLIAALGAIADSSPTAVRNMFIDNGVDALTGAHTWTVRFYAGGVADYVTVDAMLPTDALGNLVYQGAGSPASDPKGLWIALAEKAYAQWNETGNEGRDGRNSYAGIESGWMSDVDAQVLGHNANSYDLSSSGDQQALINGVRYKKAVTISTTYSSRADGNLPYGLIGGHAYTVTGYNSKYRTFTLYNPWGTNQPTRALTWAQLQSLCDGFVVANASGSQPIATAGVASAKFRRVMAPRPARREFGTLAALAADEFFRHLS